MVVDRIYALEKMKVPAGGPSPRPYIFLAGPTPRDRMVVKSWRPEACALLDTMLPEGTIIIPEDEGVGEYDPTKGDQVAWEWEGLEAADCVMFWVCRNMQTLPGLTTNVEYGMLADSGKIVLGYPSEAEHLGYLDRLAERYDVPTLSDLRTTCAFAAAMAHINYRDAKLFNHVH